MFLLCSVWTMSSFSLGWKDNGLVGVTQALASTTCAVNCWMCLKAQSVLDHRDPLFPPVYNTSGVHEGNWFPIVKAWTIMYRVRIVISQDDHKVPPCLTVPLIKVLKEVIFKGQNREYTSQLDTTWRTNSLCVNNAVFLFQLWMTFTAKAGWAEAGWDKLPFGWAYSPTFCHRALAGFVFIWKLNGVPWAMDCVTNSSTAIHYLLATLVTAFSFHPAQVT